MKLLLTVFKKSVQLVTLEQFNLMIIKSNEFAFSYF